MIKLKSVLKKITKVTKQKVQKVHWYNGIILALGVSEPGSIPGWTFNTQK